MSILKDFGQILKNDIFLNLEINLSTNDQDILFGNATNGTTTRVENFIYLTAKTYIFKCTSENRSLTVCDYYGYVKTLYDKHEYNSKLQLKHSSFVKTWGILQWLFL